MTIYESDKQVTELKFTKGLQHRRTFHNFIELSHHSRASPKMCTVNHHRPHVVNTYTQHMYIYTFIYIYIHF